MIEKLTSYASIIGVIGAIGGGFYAWGEFNTRLDGIENKDFVINEEIIQKVSDANAEIYKEFGKMRDLIGELSKLVSIVQKENELQSILIQEIKEENSSPLGN